MYYITLREIPFISFVWPTTDYLIFSYLLLAQSIYQITTKFKADMIYIFITEFSCFCC